MMMVGPFLMATGYHSKGIYLIAACVGFAMTIGGAVLALHMIATE